jgi:uncharacterized membrane protein
MLDALMVGAATGLRSATPLAVIGLVHREGFSRLTGSRARLALGALAAAEALGDKLPVSPDRTIPPGLAMRLATGAFGGAALARPGRRRAAALAAALASVPAAYLGLALRRRAMARFGQVGTGLVEDALAVLLSIMACRAASASG